MRSDNTLEFHNKKEVFYRKVIKLTDEFNKEFTNLIKDLQIQPEHLDFIEALKIDFITTFICNLAKFPQEYPLEDFETFIKSLNRKLRKIIYYPSKEKLAEILNQ